MNRLNWVFAALLTIVGMEAVQVRELRAQGQHYHHRHQHYHTRIYGPSAPRWSGGGVFLGGAIGPGYYQFQAGYPVYNPLGGSYYGYGPPAYGYSGGPGFGNGQPYAFAPGTYQLAPEFVGPSPFQNPVFPGELDEKALQWGHPEPIASPRPVRASSPAAKERSLHLQGQGDFWFDKQNFAQAYARYQQASAAAQDVAAPHFRAGIALAAMSRYEMAVSEIKKGLALDPSWPVTGESLTELFGEEKEIAKQALLHDIADWVRGDIRDANRLFLLAVCMHFDGDTERAATVFQAAARLSGSPDHIQVFLNPPQAPAAPPDPDFEKLPPEIQKLMKPSKAPAAGPAVVPRKPILQDDEDPPRPEPASLPEPAGPKLFGPQGAKLPPVSGFKSGSRGAALRSHFFTQAAGLSCGHGNPCLFAPVIGNRFPRQAAS